VDRIGPRTLVVIDAAGQAGTADLAAPSTAPSQQWKLLLHNAAADNASSYFALKSASGASEHRRAVAELLLAVTDEAA
jgi:hypothetical protein